MLVSFMQLGISFFFFFFFKQKTAYEMVRSDWSSDVCSSDLRLPSWWHSWHRTELLRSPAASMSSMAGQFRRCELSPTSDYQTRGCGACQRESGGDQHNQTKSGNEGFI